MNVNIAENASMCTVAGLGGLLGNIDLVKKLAINTD